LKIGFFGDGPWAHRALASLLKMPGLNVDFVCVRHDKPDLSLLDIAKENNVLSLSVANINSEEFMSEVSKHCSDLFVSMSFNQIFKSDLYSFPSSGTINCHAGKLPFYRGRNVLNWVLINDETEFGITVHYVDSGIDTGEIIVQECFGITDSDNYGTLLELSYKKCPELLVVAIEQIMSGRVQPISQQTIHPTGFYCSRRLPGDEIIQWSSSTSREVFSFVRALSKPGPQALTFCKASAVRINRVELIPGSPIFKGIPGAILSKDAATILVKTTDSFVRVSEWTSKEVLRVGDRFI